MTLKTIAAFAAAGLLAGLALLAGPASADTPLTKEEAISRILNVSPSLEAARARVAERDAAVTQASVRPNPTIGAEIENFMGTGPFTGLDRTEMTVTYAQQLERGNKRGLRTKLAREEARISEAQWRVRRLDLIHMAERAFVNACAAKARLEKRRVQLSTLRDIEAVIHERVKAGKDSDLAAQNASIRTLNAENLVFEAEQTLEGSKLALAGLWGDNHAAFTLSVAGAFGLPKAMTPLATGALLDGADVAVWRQKEAAREASLRLEKARAVQDPTLRVGMRYLQVTSDVAAVAEISIPWALHDTNSGNIRRARAAISRSRYERLEVERQLTLQLTMAHTQQLTAFKAARQLDENLQAARRSEALVMERLESGAASYLDVFAARSLVTDVEFQQLDAVVRFHFAQADINRLTATYSTDAVTPVASFTEDAGLETDRRGY